MKFLVLTSQVYQLGGAEKLAVELVHGLNSGGISADLGVMFLSKDSNRQNSEIISELGKKYRIGNTLDLAIPSNPGIWQIVVSVFRLIKYIRKYKYTHLETSLVTPSVVATIATFVTPIVHIVGFHQSYQPVFATDIKYKFFFLLNNIAKKNRYYAISDGVGKSWKSCPAFKRLAIKTIYNSIDPFFLQEGSLASKSELFPGSKNVILSVGRITMQKGYHVLFDAIKDQLVAADISLFFLGQKQTETDEEEAEYTRIQGEISDLGLRDRVFFLGFKENVHDYIANCDLLVHPTAFEGFGLVLIEAMILRKPIITTNVDAIPEILSNTGICQLSYGCTTELQNAILSFFSKPGDWDEPVNAGFERAGFFTLQRRVSSIVSYSLG